jgi:hypothetical protein
LALSKEVVAAGDVPSSGITANFANALAEIVAKSPKIQIGVDQKARKKFEPVSFSREDEEPLRHIADHLAPRVEVRDRRISGTVVNMSETRGQKSGSYILETRIGGETKNVRVPYSKSERPQVIEAYDRKSELMVSVEGTLVRSAGGRYTVEKVIEFEVLPRGSLT